mmetsp:Transcript_43496/g.107587  ORF Transcript_43496/g.107587 Transcript_43496/m.107587 type:complete len:258 (-) Transcript_43496:115-888(-)
MGRREESSNSERQEGQDSSDASPSSKRMVSASAALASFNRWATMSTKLSKRFCRTESCDSSCVLRACVLPTSALSRVSSSCTNHFSLSRAFASASLSCAACMLMDTLISPTCSLAASRSSVLRIASTSRRRTFANSTVSLLASALSLSASNRAMFAASSASRRPALSNSAALELSGGGPIDFPDDPKRRIDAAGESSSEPRDLFCCAALPKARVIRTLAATLPKLCLPDLGSSTACSAVACCKISSKSASRLRSCTL